MNPVNQQLLLVKYLYQKGEHALAEKGMFSAGLAVSMFQDAVELLLWTTAVHVDAKPIDKFDGMWDAIKQGTKYPVGKDLPLRSAMTSLNKARVGFKHYGITPDATDAAKFGAYAEEFLTVVFREFFSVDLATFSLVQLVQNPTVLAHLKAAEGALANGASPETVEESAKAHAYADLDLSRILPRLGFDFELFIARTVKPGQKSSLAARRAEEMETVIQAQRNFIVATALNISLADFLRFNRMAPAVYFLPKGVVVDWANEELRKNITLSDAAFSLHYVTRFAIALERTVAGVNKDHSLAPW